MLNVVSVSVYYVIRVDDGEFIKSNSYCFQDFPKNDIITFVHGMMYEAGWCPGTSHAIFAKNEIGGTYECIHDEDDTLEALMDSMFPQE